MSTKGRKAGQPNVCEGCLSCDQMDTTDVRENPQPAVVQETARKEPEDKRGVDIPLPAHLPLSLEEIADAQVGQMEVLYVDVSFWWALSTSMSIPEQSESCT
jgi:hypothetical protein